jgi:thiamine biosynthesis lipoprotein
MGSADPAANWLHRVELVMGTAISVEITDPLPDDRRRHLAQEAFDWFRAVDERFSTYREDSELNRLDRGELRIEDGSTELRLVFDRCAELWQETDGYFDVQATGRLDPSGFVKGWSAQVASDRLLAAGAANHCVNAGGDVRVRGVRRPGEPWQIGIRHPFAPLEVCAVIAGTDLAVAGSGSYERGHHVIDPFRGAPATDLVSVTVVGQDLGSADAYATAAMAMGTRGLDWLDRLAGYEAHAVTADGRSFRTAGLPTAPAA